MIWMRCLKMITNKEKSFISAVVYVQNSQDTIGYFLEQLSNVLLSNFEKHEIICVNDCSEDESVKIIKTISKKISSSVLSVVNLSFYQGMETAMNAGRDLAIGDFIFEFDNCSIDYDFELIMQLYRKSLDGYDIVAASNGKPSLFSKIFYRVYNKATSSQYEIGTETFRILTRRAINRIHSMSKNIPYRKALYYNSGLKNETIIYHSIKEIKTSYSKRQSKNRQDSAITTLVLFTNIAYRITMIMTSIMMLATLSGAIYTLAIYINKKPVAGYTTMMLVLTGSFFGVFAVLSIVIKYLAILTDLVFRKQKYIIESIEKITN